MATRLVMGCIAVREPAAADIFGPGWAHIAIGERHRPPVGRLKEAQAGIEVGVLPFGMTKDELERVVVGVCCKTETPLKLGVAIGIVGDVADMGDTRRGGLTRQKRSTAD